MAGEVLLTFGASPPPARRRNPAVSRRSPSAARGAPAGADLQRARLYGGEEACLLRALSFPQDRRARRWGVSTRARSAFSSGAQFRQRPLIDRGCEVVGGAREGFSGYIKTGCCKSRAPQKARRCHWPRSRRLRVPWAKRTRRASFGLDSGAVHDLAVDVDEVINLLLELLGRVCVAHAKVGYRPAIFKRKSWAANEDRAFCLRFQS